MDAKVRNFLARADTVAANYRHRIIELEETLKRQLLASLLDVSRVNLNVLNTGDRLEKLQAEYTAPHKRMSLMLDEALKKLAYQFKHCDDPNQLCKLTNTQVRVVGAMHVINEKLERKHHRAIQDAEYKVSLNAPPVEVES